MAIRSYVRETLPRRLETALSILENEGEYLKIGIEEVQSSMGSR